MTETAKQTEANPMTPTIEPMSDERLAEYRASLESRWPDGLTPDDCKALLARLDARQAVVDRLPKFTDGVPYIPTIEAKGFAVWKQHGGEDDAWRVSECHHKTVDDDPGWAEWDWIIPAAEDTCDVFGVYSTRAAAEAALAKEAPTTPQDGR